MGYQVYEDSKTGRWSGYGVQAECDRPDCATKIDRGLAYRCEDHGHWRPLLGVVHSGQTGIPIPKIEEESLLRSGGDNSYDRGNAVLINVSSPLRRR